MTPIDRSRFTQALRTVALVCNKVIKPDVIDAYFEALAAVPIEDIERAGRALARTTKFWPKPVEWLTEVQRTSVAPPVSLPPPVVLQEDGTQEVAFHCARCEDTGWRPDCGCVVGALDIKGHCPVHGGRYVKLHDTTYARARLACECRGTNPTWNANHQTRYVESK